MTRRPRLTVRARLTLIYTGLFTLCGAIIVAVSYILVAQLGVVQQPGASSSAGLSASYIALCKKAYLSGDKEFLGSSKCPASVLAALGAQQQYDLTLTRLLQYSLITLVIVISLSAVLGLDLRRKGTAPRAPDYRCGPGRVGTQSLGPGCDTRPSRRTHRTGRDLRRHARPAPGCLRGSAAVHRQRLPRAAHPACGHAHHRRCRFCQPKQHS